MIPDFGGDPADNMELGCIGVGTSLDAMYSVNGTLAFTDALRDVVNYVAETFPAAEAERIMRGMATP